MFPTRALRVSVKPFHASSVVEEEARKQMKRWTKISVLMLGLTGTVGAIEWVAHLEDHDPHRPHEEPHKEPPHYSYLKIRNKPFPWHYSNCDLLDLHCKDLARAAEQALKNQGHKQ